MSLKIPSLLFKRYYISQRKRPNTFFTNWSWTNVFHWQREIPPPAWTPDNLWFCQLITCGPTWTSRNLGEFWLPQLPHLYFSSSSSLRSDSRITSFIKEQQLVRSGVGGRVHCLPCLAVSMKFKKVFLFSNIEGWTLETWVLFTSCATLLKLLNLFDTSLIIYKIVHNIPVPSLSEGW